MPDKQYGAISFFHIFILRVRVCFKTTLHLLQLFRRMMKHCLTVNLQKSFVDYKTSPDFSSAWKCEDND